jgi:Glycosyl transferases group 1
VILNVFRTVHHFNRAGVPASSLNPRVYEAVACGALMFTEHRPELDDLCPEMPVFRGDDDLVGLLEGLARDDRESEGLRRSCARRLAGHTYADRLCAALRASLGVGGGPIVRPSLMALPRRAPDDPPPRETPNQGENPLPPELDATWARHGNAASFEPTGEVILRKARDDGPGTEQGLVSRAGAGSVSLSFGVRLGRGTTFLAKIHQERPDDPPSNSYHVFSDGASGYVARHHHVLGKIHMLYESWANLQFVYHEGLLILRIDGRTVYSGRDATLRAGHCFVGTKGGALRIRHLEVRRPPPRIASSTGPTCRIGRW